MNKIGEVMVKKINKKIEDLKIGDWVYDFESNIRNGVTPFLDYHFYKITGETKKYWILNNNCCKIRKSDLKIRGYMYYKCAHLMTDYEIEMKKQKDIYMKKKV